MGNGLQMWFFYQGYLGNLVKCLFPYHLVILETKEALVA